MGTIRRTDKGVGTTAAGGAGGSFARPSGSPLERPVRLSEQDNYWSFSPHELGLDGIPGVTLVDVQRLPDTGEVTVHVNFHEDPVALRGLTQEQFDRGYHHIEHVLTERYGAESVQNTDGTSVSFSMSAELGDRDVIDDHAVLDAVWIHTRMVQFANERDRGTIGGEHLYRIIGEDIDRGWFPVSGDDRDIDFQKVAVAKAAAAAVTLNQPADSCPQVLMIAERGYCTDAEAARVELRRARRDRRGSAELEQLEQMVELDSRV